ncbi:MAG TPA: hypothetical protein VFF68_02650 [Anaerolineaceae bacterium]|nr:hypothetical protein [Anaerolineaceae bacterium]
MFTSALPGTRYGRLVVTEIIDGQMRKCVCDCGEKIIVRRCNLTSGNTRSCGCLRREIEKTAARTHGATTGKTWSRAYTIWHGMRQRCLNPRNPSFPQYGGRGIAVCEEWKDSFEAFLADMGEPPEGHSINRINNDGPYSKENCAWASNEQQQRNKTSNRMITFRGKTKSLADWSEEVGIPYFALHARFRRGWSVEKALSTEVQRVQ